MIRHVHAGDGDHLALLHLLGQLVRQLHGLDARLEGAAERALDQAPSLASRLRSMLIGPRRYPATGSRGSPVPYREEGAAVVAASITRAAAIGPATPPRGWSRTVADASRSPSAAWAAIRTAAQAPAASRSTAPAAANHEGERRRERRPDDGGSQRGRGQERPTASAAAADRVLPVARGSTPSGTPNRSALPVSASAAGQPEEADGRERRSPPGSAREGRHADVCRREADDPEQRCQRRQGPQQPRAGQQERHGRQRCEQQQRRALAASLGDASQPHTPRAPDSQPTRGSIAVMTAAAGGHCGDREGRSRGPGRRAQRPRARPGPLRPGGGRASRRRGGGSAAAPRRCPGARASRAPRDRPRRRGPAPRRAARPPARGWTAQPGSVSSASSITSQSSGGRSRRRAASGSGRPIFLAVAAGPRPRTGFVPVQAS